MLLLRVALKAKTCLSFSILTVQPPAVESEKKEQERHTPGFNRSLITLTAASKMVKNAERTKVQTLGELRMRSIYTANGGLGWAIDVYPRSPARSLTRASYDSR